MRALIIDDVAKAKVARVLAYAERHHYRPGPGIPPPGDDGRFVALLNAFRCVFTFTHAGDMIWRHLSISVPGKNYPNPAAALMIAELFGFTGWDGKTIDRFPKDWIIDVNKDERCVV